jgi:hypothetical protein
MNSGAMVSANPSMTMSANAPMAMSADLAATMKATPAPEALPVEGSLPSLSGAVGWLNSPLLTPGGAGRLLDLPLLQLSALDAPDASSTSLATSPWQPLGSIDLPQHSFRSPIGRRSRCQ